jgi:hypothetical protein
VSEKNTMNLKVVMPRLALPKVRAADMNVGQGGVIVEDELKIPSYNGTEVIRIYSGLVSLANPERVWTGGVPPFWVEVYPPGTKVTLTLL